MQPELTKVGLRKHLLHQRTSLSPQEWQHKSQQICQQLHRSVIFQRSRRILAFFSFRQEPDLSPLWMQPQETHIEQFGFPRCVDRQLEWHLWSPGQPLTQGKYGVLEPHPDLPTMPPRDVDLILVPCLGFDHHGYRLGYGGGFYDRLFSQPQWQTVPAIGIGFELGYLERFPQDPWDRPLSGICTESSLFMIDRP